jgi:integrase
LALRPRNGHWHYRFEYKGKEYSGSTGLAATPQNKREAIAVEAEALIALKQGSRPVAKIEAIQFQQGVSKFLTWAEIQYRAHPNSYKRIKTSLSSAQVFMRKLPVSAIDAIKLEEYMKWRVTAHGVRDVTVRHDVLALSTFFKYAIRHHWISSNPVREIEIPSDAEAQRMYVLSMEEEENYFRRAKRFPDLHDVGRLMINQGMRPEEVTALAKEDIDLQRGTIRVCWGKTTAAKRVLDMTSEAREILRARMNGASRWIFPSKRKPGCHIGRVNSAHDSLIEEAGREGVDIRFVPYDLRHTFATRVAQGGTDLPTLASLLGHGSVRCVHKYVHPTAEHKKNAMRRYERNSKAARRRAKATAKALCAA